MLGPGVIPGPRTNTCKPCGMARKEKKSFVQHIEIAYCLLVSVADFERPAIYLIIPLKLTCLFYPTFQFTPPHHTYLKFVSVWFHYYVSRHEFLFLWLQTCNSLDLLNLRICVIILPMVTMISSHSQDSS